MAWEQPGRKDPQVLRVPKAQQARKVQREQMVPQEQPDRKAPQVQMVPKARKELQGQRVRKDCKVSKE